MIRRTPAKTREARELFEELTLAEQFTPGVTVPKIANTTGLTDQQVRDALFGESADAWRRDLINRRAK